MKVLAGPRVDLDPAGPAARLCWRLAGEDGQVVSLAAAGLRNPYRRLSAAEVEAVRGPLRGQTGVVGFVCRGVAVGPAGVLPVGSDPLTPRLAIVTDHVNLTWRSPLEGPNDDQAGPRFPCMDGVYAPEVSEAAARPAGEEDGMIVVRGVVVGVPDDRTLSGYETETAGRSGWTAASSELVAPVILAGHMGLRVAAVVMLW